MVTRICSGPLHNLHFCRFLNDDLLLHKEVFDKHDVLLDLRYGSTANVFLYPRHERNL